MSKKPANSIKSRLDKLRRVLKDNQALLLSTPHDVFYLSGFNFLVPEEREAFLIITKKSVFLLHASFSPYQSINIITPIKSCSLDKLKQQLQQLYQQESITWLLIDKTSLFVNEYEAIKELPFLKFSALDRQLIWKLRMIKDQTELSSLKKAAKLASLVMHDIWAKLKINITEKQLRDLVEAKLKQAGSERVAFPPIVAFGANSALPHHQPTDAKLTPETVVLIDFGATVCNYCSDMTRTIWFGDKPNPEFLKIEQVVKQAYQATLKKLNKKTTNQPILAQSLDQTARQIITDAGYGKNFIHTTGHGLGISLHESLSLNWQNQQEVLPNMVVTIEPGIYLENKFGYRYENTILITDSQAKELTR
ncbi:Xaa-Pro peptidase family protein [Patescibacteria group bacterium]|nr:Xaa-Pro peptidase family protein [Patescibacteria group bacterium]MBU1967481.1 Xaa-Pro peptidase family protein [Patescibacteria group bacterium]MBU2542976.1 Xaa-Pro peptidase family protein [Patescibacteria group bacterium]